MDEHALAGFRTSVSRSLEGFVGRHAPMLPLRLADAVRYAATGGGKRFRGVLVCAAYDAVGGSADASELAAAVEIIHAYSLVHDDLPCMDNDDLRRGRPSLHRAFDVRTAVCVGAIMVPLAARGAFVAARALGLSDRESAHIVSGLMIAAGASGMIAGQQLDLEGEGRKLLLPELESIHRAKTGALIASAAVTGARAARATPEVGTAFANYGRRVGLAFQIADDVLDVTANSVELGKTAGSDAALGKSSYAAHLGVDGARAEAARLITEACSALEEQGVLTPLLHGLAHQVLSRRS